LKWLKRDLIVLNQGYLQCYYLHANPPNISKVIKVFLHTHLRSLNVHHFWMAEATRLKKCDITVTLKGSTCLQNFTKIHQSVQKLLAGDRQRERERERQTERDRQTDRQTHTLTHTGWWFDRPTFIFESKLKSNIKKILLIGISNGRVLCVFVLWHVLHPWLGSMKDQWNVNKLYSILFYSILFYSILFHFRYFNHIIVFCKLRPCLVFFLPRPHNTTPLLRLLQQKVVAHISAACSDHTNIAAIGTVKHLYTKVVLQTCLLWISWYLST
jgi:hypothetical protein